MLRRDDGTDAQRSIQAVARGIFEKFYKKHLYNPRVFSSDGGRIVRPGDEININENRARRKTLPVTRFDVRARLSSPASHRGLTYRFRAEPNLSNLRQILLAEFFSRRQFAGCSLHSGCNSILAANSFRIRRLFYASSWKTSLQFHLKVGTYTTHTRRNFTPKHQARRLKIFTESDATSLPYFSPGLLRAV